MKSSILWDIMPCSPLKVKHHFGGTFHLHLQSQRISQARALLATCFMLVSCFAYFFGLYPEDGGRNVPLKRQLIFNGLHSIISQKIELFKRRLGCAPEDSWLCRYGQTETGKGRKGLGLTGMLTTHPDLTRSVPVPNSHLSVPASS
jgi:hypothetical protein